MVAVLIVRCPPCRLLCEEVVRVAGSRELPVEDLAHALGQRACLSLLKLETHRSRHFFVQILPRHQAIQACQTALHRVLASIGRLCSRGGSIRASPWDPRRAGRLGECVCAGDCLGEVCPCFRAGAFCTAACRGGRCRSFRCRNRSAYFSHPASISVMGMFERLDPF